MHPPSHLPSPTLTHSLDQTVPLQTPHTLSLSSAAAHTLQGEGTDRKEPLQDLELEGQMGEEAS